MMPLPGPSTMAADALQGLPVLEAISGIFGSISMVAWIFVILPQLVTNYKAKSADGLSMSFLVIWMLGDVTNLIGAILTHLAPTAIVIACYFCFADCALIAQCVYYNTINANKAAASAAATAAAAHDQGPNEESPLLATGEQSAKDSNAVDDMFGGRAWLRNTAALLAVHVIGFVGWFVSVKAGAWDGSEPQPPTTLDDGRTLGEAIGLILGYVSAVFYLCARIPQIIKNFRDKSCEGLSLLFFMLSLTGNGTYGISLLTYSQDPKYLVNSIPWLLGSVGTMVEDSIIFLQFHLYGENSRTTQSVV